VCDAGHAGWVLSFILEYSQLTHEVVRRVKIDSFRDGWLRDFFIDDKSSKWILPAIKDRLFRKLQLTDDATTDADLRSSPSNHFEKLSGKLSNLHSIRVNQQWRLIFVWHADRGLAENIYFDNHSYR
jgi:toxin HigB-1